MAAKPSFWDYVLDSESAGADYQQVKQDERTSASAGSLHDIIGSEAQAPESQGQGPLRAMPGTGMFEDASPAMVTQLSQIQGMLGSGDATLQQMGMEQYGEFIAPPSTAGTSPSATYKDYQQAKTEGYPGDFMKYQTDLRRAMVADPTSGAAMDIDDIKKYNIRGPEGDRPLANVGTSLRDIMTGAGLEEGESYIAAPSASQEARKEKTKRAGDVLGAAEEMLFGANGIMNDERYDPSWGGSVGTIAQHWTQEDPRYSAYTGFVNGTISTIVKSLGEAGALAEGDIARALSLMPKLAQVDPAAGIYNLKSDTQAVARIKLKNLKALLEKWTTGKAPTPEEAKADLDMVFASAEMMSLGEKSEVESPFVLGEDGIYRPRG